MYIQIRMILRVEKISFQQVLQLAMISLVLTFFSLSQDEKMRELSEMEQVLSQANVEKSELEEIAANYQVGQAVQLPSTCMHERQSILHTVCVHWNMHCCALRIQNRQQYRAVYMYGEFYCFTV